ncbi:hypothetical protein [Cognaticolwellia mytili]|uniref:hypothetical protein n=1 Tax=Cognaticolwellia mytili TaxID=1888913 RepID=UPI000A1778EE|nr:hypothetical protein [Cognaticolwellia mytili]
MTDMLSRIDDAIGDSNFSYDFSTPIVDEALKLVSNTETPLQKRLPQIYQLLDDATAAGGAERERSKYIIEALYASADEDELIAIKTYESSL